LIVKCEVTTHTLDVQFTSRAAWLLAIGVGLRGRDLGMRRLFARQARWTLVVRLGFRGAGRSGEACSCFCLACNLTVFITSNTVAVRKFAISVPEDVMAQIDEAAERRGITRSRFITDVLRKVARARTDAEVTRRLDEVFAAPDVAAEQRSTSQALLGARIVDDEW
jgi:hypothetical protein